MSLTVGHITYANCVPFFRHLQDSGFCGQIVPGVPAHLNTLLAAGQIDLSPSSSFEYARNWRDYLLLPDLSISANGPVKSVLLFSPKPPQELSGTQIALTGESASSTHLLHILLREFHGVKEVRAAVPAEPIENSIAADRPALLIGDRALRAALSPPGGTMIYDLGELWQRHTGLPFVFALWILRRQAAFEKPAEIRTFMRQLTESRRRALADFGLLATEAPEREWLGEKGLIDYWQAMSYDLPAGHLQGLQLFFDLCYKHDLLEESAEIRFFT
jgi:chorismate dehydratase